MKRVVKVVIYSAAVLLLSLQTSCKKFLEQVPDDKKTIDDVFKKKSDTDEYLANIYGYIRTETDWSNGAPWEGLSDELDVTYNDYATYAMNLGNWDRNRDSYNYWTHYYRGIRAASYFLQRVDENEELKNPPYEGLIPQYKAEARFLRAYFYFMLMRQFGPVILLPEMPIAPDATIEEMTLPRSSYDECVDYLVSEIDRAIPDLPIVPVNGQTSTNDWGRMNKGIALAVKSRLLLYAASPQFNGNADYASLKNPDGKQLISQDYDANKWKRAVDAAKVVIDLPDYQLFKELDNAGHIKAYESLKKVFYTDWNPEIIFAKINTDWGFHDQNCSPRTVGGWSSWGPTQQAVDAYFMANGKSPIHGYNADGSPIINTESGYTETGFTNTSSNYYASGTFNMYVNREPRFYVAITFNGSKWINNSFGSNGQPAIIQTYNGGNSGKYTGRNYSRTGYISRKLVNPNTTLNPGNTGHRSEIFFRLAEIYLNYAEAANEYQYSASSSAPSALFYLNEIRKRAGIPQYGVGDDALPIPETKEKMREAIQKERRVELAFENHRFFDVRRWKIADKTLGGAFYGMDIEANNTNDFSRRVVFETRDWNDKYYLWNILQSELNRDKQLVENPGW